METREFRAEIQQLLNILVHSLYTDREIFVRELISNASDALHRLQFEMLTNRDVLDPTAELAIHVQVDDEAKTITISDTGIGMTQEELSANLGTIAQSGAAAFIERLGEMEDNDRPAIEMIGQFGVGFYSAFMVAQEIHVVSRSFEPDAQAAEWISDGQTEYQVGPAEKAERGTDVIVHLKEDAHEFCNTWRLEQIVKKHSDFVPFPIYVDDEVVNRQKPLWRQSPQETDEQEYVEFYKHLTMDADPPLLHVHTRADVPVDIRSILYIPAKRDQVRLDLRTDHGLRLYAKGVMIQEANKDMLPNHLRFVEGVIESQDLPLNVSRETVQRNPAVRRIQKALVGRLTRELESLAQDDPDKYDQFWQEFGPFIKEGIATDFADRDALMPLLRFHTSQTVQTDDAKPISLKEYVDQMTEDQSAIYYLLGEDLESIGHSPHLDYFRANDIPVLYLVDPIDSFMVMSLTEHEEKPFKSIDDPSLDLPTEESQEPKEDATDQKQDLSPLIGRIATVLGDKVASVRESHVLRDSPCRLVAQEGAPGRDMQRVYRLLNQEIEASPMVFEVNRRHPVVHNLVQMLEENPKNTIIDPTIEQLYENQLLLEGIHPNPAAMVSRIQALIEAATKKSADT